MINNYKIIPNLILIDGILKEFRYLTINQLQGDSLSASISSASLIAKAERDKIMMKNFIVNILNIVLINIKVTEQRYTRGYLKIRFT